MPLFSKVKRILFKTLAGLLLILILLGIVAYFAVQSYNFQTYLAKLATEFLSKELETEIKVDRIELDLFSKLHLKNVIIYDRHKDTVLSGNFVAEVSKFDYSAKSITIKRIELENTSVKIIYHKNEKNLNIDFLVDYFAGDQEVKKIKKGKQWEVSLNSIELNNVCFAYRDERQLTDISKNMNFNNLLFTETFGIISNIKLDKDYTQVKVKDFTTKEQCGFKLKKLNVTSKISSVECLLTNLNLETDSTKINGNIEFAYNEWADFNDFINKIKINSELRDGTRVSFIDIARFAPDLNGLNKTIYLNGLIHGFVSDLNLKNFKLSYGKHTCFNGDMQLSGLPVFKTTYLKFKARQIATSYNDLAQTPNYPFSEGGYLQIPSELKTFGVITYKGMFDGFISDFVSKGTLSTALGKIDTDLRMKIGKKEEDIIYDGRIEAHQFNLGALLSLSSLNNLNLTTKIKGSGLSLAKLRATLDGQISSCNYNGYTYKGISFDGSFLDKVFKGKTLSKDANANFDFDGTINFKNKVPEMDFISNINQLNLSELNLASKTSADSGIFSSLILINLKGDNLDNLTGQINFDDTKYKTKTKTYKLSSFNLDLDQAQQEKTIKLTSAYFNTYLKGKFGLSTLAPSFSQFLSNYYPTFFKSANNNLYTDSLSFNVLVKNFTNIKELFVPDLMLAPGTKLTGNFAARFNQMDFSFSSAMLDYHNIKFESPLFNAKTEGKIISSELNGKKLAFTDSVFIENFNLCLRSRDKNTKYDFEWDDLLKPSNKGEFAGQVLFSNQSIYLQHDTINIVVKDSAWTLTTTNPSVFNLDGSYFINPLVFKSNAQSVGIAGTLANNSKNILAVNFSNVILEQFKPILSVYKIDLKGFLTGDMQLQIIDKQLAADGNLNFDKFIINNNNLGILSVKSKYDPFKKSLNLDGYTSLGSDILLGTTQKNISFEGNYYFDNREESIDIDFKASPANLNIINPYLEGILSMKYAYVKGSGKVHGNPNNVKIDGKLNLFKSEVKVDYTNVIYNITGDIEISPDQIRFVDLLLSEKNLKASPQGTLNGNLFHDKYSKMQLDYSLYYNNMLVLNTNEKLNKTFYGKMYGNGHLDIYGFLNNLHMIVSYESTKNSKFFLPLDGPNEIENSDFIKFVKKDTVKQIEEKISGFDLDMNVVVNPELQTKIILDKKTGDVITAQGNGNINLKISTLGKFDMVGDYFFTNGNYNFTLENLINKKFDIEPGSVISWAGDPLNAQIDIVTSYKQKASVAPLLNNSEDKGRYAVDCQLLIGNKLLEPSINFKIDFPTLDPSLKSRISNVLSDDVELNRQVFSFLLFRNFVTPAVFSGGGGVVNAGSAAASTGSEMLSNNLSNFLNSTVGNLTGIKDLQLGLNYRTKDAVTGQAVDLALSKQFLNNRVTVDGNFGVNNNPQARNGLIGDVNVEYKLSEDGRYRIKGFNRTNDNTQLTTLGGQYSQGIGIFYREEFETINALFTSYLNKLKRNKTAKKKENS